MERLYDLLLKSSEPVYLFIFLSFCSILNLSFLSFTETYHHTLTLERSQRPFCLYIRLAHIPFGIHCIEPNLNRPRWKYVQEYWGLWETDNVLIVMPLIALLLNTTPYEIPRTHTHTYTLRYINLEHDDMFCNGEISFSCYGHCLNVQKTVVRLYDTITNEYIYNWIKIIYIRTVFVAPTYVCVRIC